MLSPNFQNIENTLTLQQKHECIKQQESYRESTTVPITGLGKMKSMYGPYSWSLKIIKSGYIYIYQKKPQIIQKHIDTKYSEHSHPQFLKTNTVSIFLSHGLVVPIQRLAQCSINIVEITWE